MARVNEALPAALNVNFLPAQPIGYSIEHMDTEGTQTLAFSEAVNQWIGMGENLHAGGIRKLVMLNAHGGNAPLMTIVATELRTRLDMLAVATSWTRFGLPEGLIAPDDKALDIHGGFIETSVMLALRPDLVDMTKAAHFSNEQSDFAKQFKHLRAYGPHAFGWKMHDLNSEGVAGNASAATAEAGEKFSRTLLQALLNFSMTWISLTLHALRPSNWRERDWSLCNNIALHIAFTGSFPYMNYPI